MEQGLQKLNADQRLPVWTQRISDCRSSGVSVKHWCQEKGISEKTYYYWQRRIYKMAREQQEPEFAELHGFQSISPVTASLAFLKTRSMGFPDFYLWVQSFNSLPCCSTDAFAVAVHIDV